MSYDSAIEAMCDNPGDPIFHLTAMALNCCISGFGPDCSGGGVDDYLSNLFAQANASCAIGGSDRANEVDCWNNGGVFHANTDFCQTGTCEPVPSIGVTQIDRIIPIDGGIPCNDKTICPVETACVPLPGNCHSMDLCNEDLGLCFDESKPAGSSKACKDAKKNACNVFDGVCTNGSIGGSCD
jgi:hypothetical protein